MFFQKSFMVITNEFSEIHGYNEHIFKNHSYYASNYEFNYNF